MKQFYNADQEPDRVLWANATEGHEYDFRREKIYKLPLEYPHIFKMVHGDFKDFTGTNGAAPIFSKKLRDIIMEFVPKEELEWIHVQVENKDGSLNDAYIPRFQPMPHMFDVLNEELTRLTSDGDLMVPRLSEKKTKNKHFIRLLENPLYTYVSADLRKAMMKAKITGVKYKKEKMYP